MRDFHTDKESITTYECLIEVALFDRSFEDLRKCMDGSTLCYGTALHEKLSGVSAIISMFKKQRSEMQNSEMKITRNLVLNKSIAQGNAHLIVEEFNFDTVEVDFIMRLSTILELVNGKWCIPHFHASTPDANVAEGHALPLEEMHIKNMELEAKVKEGTEELNQSIANLKSTQSQLIQSEKMASLGELTAGIAHEIQNPLNFVNNFAEVSGVLIEELKAERSKLKARHPDGQAERDEALEEEILDDIVQNLEKINHHGQRASGIVKGMLEHSRTSTGKKELTDINVLADEYLRLAYHGLRAKDKTFNAEFKMEFDETLPKINVISQDIARVLLNLINNAFYAVDKKSKEGISGYKPEVIMSTKLSPSFVGGQGKEIQVSIKDNGSGIPAEIKDKIFQPFFTTKPTGQGTGLGLSLSYDIVKAHGGEISVDSKPSIGTTFILTIPADP